MLKNDNNIHKFDNNNTTNNDSPSTAHRAPELFRGPRRASKC